MSARFEMRGEHGPELEFLEAVEVKERWPDNPLLLLYGTDLAVLRKEEAGDGDG